MDNENKVETPEVFKSFESEEDYNKILQSASSKAKGEILKDLGINSISEFKTNMEEFSKYKETQLTDTEKLNSTLKSRDTQILDLQKEIMGNKVTIESNNIFKIAVKLGVKEDSISDVIKLATFGENKDYEKGLKSVLDKYPSFKNDGKSGYQISPNIGNGKSKPKVNKGNNKYRKPDGSITF